MSKLYPPTIDSKLPAMIKIDNQAQAIIPYILNKTVSQSSVKKINLYLKGIASGRLIYTGLASSITNNQAVFNIPITDTGKQILSNGEYYKAQISCVDNSSIEGYLSTVGVIKYCENRPTISISGLNSEQINPVQNTFIGEYSSSDKDEYLYSSKFEVYNNSNELISSTGDVIYTGESEEQKHIFNLNTNLEKGQIYKIAFSAISSNQIKLGPVEYQIRDQGGFIPELKVNFKAYNAFDQGSIKLSIDPISSAAGKTVSGKFRIFRLSSEDGFKSYNQVHEFYLDKQIPSIDPLYTDNTVKCFETYQYYIEQYLNDVSSSKIYSNKIQADFEDMFLIDKNRKLNVRFNPKVQSYKTTIFEQKVDTIGGKYPLFFRNGASSYAEIPISGLISFVSDEDNSFSKKEICKDAEKIAVFNSKTMHIEREFKDEVLEWLNNGEPKLFKSPAEGNHIVRLMNVSLSPIDSVSRMLNTFSCTGYEIADYAYNNLILNNIAEIKTDKLYDSIQIQTYILTTTEKSLGKVIGELQFESKKQANVTIQINGSNYVLNNTNILKFYFDTPSSSDIKVKEVTSSGTNGIVCTYGKYIEPTYASTTLTKYTTDSSLKVDQVTTGIETKNVVMLQFNLKTGATANSSVTINDETYIIRPSGLRIENPGPIWKLEVGTNVSAVVVYYAIT